MGVFKEFLDAVSKISLVKFEIKVDKLIVGQRIYPIKGNNVILGEKKVEIVKDEYGELEGFKIGETELEIYIPSKRRSQRLLDKEGKVFTRSDISEMQIEYLSIDKKHELIINILKPFLDGYRLNWDLGSLLIASTIIKLEDKKENEDLIKSYFAKLNYSYKSLGRIIYCLFRSNILEKEIVPYLTKLKDVYPEFQTKKSFFLNYWYDITTKGYPTAYFVQYWDYNLSLHNQLKWRFDKGSTYVDVFSRGKERNKNTEEWCAEFIEKSYCKDYKIEKGKPYMLGFTPAVTIRVYK